MMSVIKLYRYSANLVGIQVKGVYFYKVLF